MVIKLKEDTTIKIGGLGLIYFKKGMYYYVGSAMGNIGSSTLINRVKRHVSEPIKKKNHWHVDYFLQDNNAEISQIFIIPNNQKIECLISEEIQGISMDQIKKFGCSDCKCKSHLYLMNEI